MAFQYVGNLFTGQSSAAPPKDVATFTETDIGALSMGTPCEFDSGGEITFASHSSAIAALVTLEDIAEEGSGRCMWLLPGMMFKVSLRKADGTVFTAVAGTGTNGIAATTLIGQSLKITTNGKHADGATGHTAGAPLVVVRIDRGSETYNVDATAWVVFKQGLLFANNIS